MQYGVNIYIFKTFVIYYYELLLFINIHFGV